MPGRVDPHLERNRRPIAHTIGRLLEVVRAHAGIAICPTGEQDLANCLRTLDLARRFERQGAPSLRSFVEYLEDEARRGRSEDAPVVEEGTEGVRIMTVARVTRGRPATCAGSWDLGTLLPGNRGARRSWSYAVLRP